MKKIKRNITKWLLKKLLKYEEPLQELEDKIYVLVALFYSESEPYDIIFKDRKLDKILFNAKYLYDVPEELMPYDELQKLYKIAGNASRELYKQPFYKILKKAGDKHIKRLNYKLKRNGG